MRLGKPHVSVMALRDLQTVLRDLHSDRQDREVIDGQETNHEDETGDTTPITSETEIRGAAFSADTYGAGENRPEGDKGDSGRVGRVDTRSDTRGECLRGDRR